MPPHRRSPLAAAHRARRQRPVRGDLHLQRSTAGAAERRCRGSPCALSPKRQDSSTLFGSASRAEFARLEKSAMILGIAGQNGRLLTEFLLNKNYRVVGFGWKDSIERSETLRPFRDKIEVCYGDLREPESLATAIQEHPVSEIYNFAAQSQPGLSWQNAVETGEVNAIGAHRLFEAVRRLRPQARIFQASSSEMFGAASRDAAARDHAVQPDQSLCGGEDLRAPDRGDLPGESRQLHRLRHPVQSREPLSRHGVPEPEGRPMARSAPSSACATRRCSTSRASRW